MAPLSLSLSEQSVVLYYYYLPIVNFFPLIQMPKIKKRKQKLTITISNTALVPQSVTHSHFHSSEREKTQQQHKQLQGIKKKSTPPQAFVFLFLLRRPIFSNHCCFTPK